MWSKVCSPAPRARGRGGADRRSRAPPLYREKPRRAVRGRAPSMRPLPPGGEKREIEPEHRLAESERACIGLELRAVALALAVEKDFAVRALVAAGLVVD